MSRSHARVFALVLAVFAVLIALSGTGGYSAVEADRGVSVSVVEDDVALLGVERPGSPAAENVSDPPVLVVTNNAQTALDLEVQVSSTRDTPGAGAGNGSDSGVDRGQSVGSGSVTDGGSVTLQPGERTIVRSTDGCGAPAANGPDGTTDVHLSAGGEGLAIELTRTVEVACR